MAFDKVQYRYQYEKEKLKRIPLDVPKGFYEEIKAYADSRHETLSGMIKRLLTEEMAKK